MNFNVKDGLFHIDDENGKIYNEQSDKWVWDSKTKTLSLNGFEWETTASIALKINGDITINLIGTNAFNVINGHTLGSIRISTEYAIIIKGNGTLNAIGKSNFNVNYGISADSITIENGVLNAVSGNVTMYSYGIKTKTLTVNGGTVNATAGTAYYSYGIYSTTTMISGGIVIAKGEGTAIWGYYLNLPASYKYWTNTTSTPPADGTGKTYPDSMAFVNNNAYKYVKIEKAALSSTNYKLTYDANGGTGAPSAQTVNANSNAILSNTKPIRESYTFMGWAASKTATSAQYQPGQQIYVSSDMILYAV